MKINQLSVESALASLKSRAGGLTSAEAARRLAEYGANRLEKIEREPLWLRCLRQFTSFFALILWLAAALALVAEWRDPGAGMALLAAAIVVVILINGVFSFWQEYRAERAIAALARLLPAHATVLRDGVAVQLESQQLVPGDIVLVQEGDQISADCRVIEAFGLRVNEATVTGEAAASDKDARPAASDDLLASRNVVLAGTLAVAGSAQALVFATGMRTEFGRIARLTQSTDEPLSPLQLEIARLSRLVAALATLLGVAFFALGWALGLPFWSNFIFAIGIIVANVPEGLLPTVTLALAMATQRMAKRNALIRHLPAVETLGSTTVICTDKTGTLTQNRMHVKRLYFADGARDYDAARLAADERLGRRRLFEVARHCHALRAVAVNGDTQLLGDPMEITLLEMARAVPGGDYPRRDEIAFDSDRKRFSTVHDTPAGGVLYCKGALEAVLPLCVAVETAAGVEPLSAGQRKRFRSAESALAHDGMRVLAFAFRALPAGSPREQWESGLTLAGLVGLEDPVRPEVPDAIRTCRAAGIKVIMVTGDHPQTALAVARAIGLAQLHQPVVITGDVLARYTEAQLQVALDEPELIFARVGANQKMVIVEALQRKNHIVAATGDGVNDAPALKRADIGVAMGIIGTDVAKEAADMILLDDNFASIVAAIEEGRAVFDNIRKFLTYILTSNIPELVPYLAFALARIPLPLTIMQILAVDLGTDMLPALALGAEKPAPGGMTRPPRPRSERLLSWPLLARAYLFLGVLEAAAAMAAFFFVLDRGGWRYSETLVATAPLYLAATAACFGAIVAMQVVNVFLCRHASRSAFDFGVFSNPLILGGIAFELGLAAAIIYTPLGNQVFGTAPLDAAVWMFLLPFALALLALEEARKWWVRRRERQAQDGQSRQGLFFDPGQAGTRAAALASMLSDKDRAMAITLRPGDALLAVDVQNDFLPGGRLAVGGGDAVIPALNRYLELATKLRLPVYASRDWHPRAHCSFAAQGGPWPQHCVAGSPGAQFAPVLELPPAATVIDKGVDSQREAYSAFEGTGLAALLRRAGVRRLLVGGLATDYCVLNTVRDALASGFEVLLLRDAIRAVNVNPEDGARAEREMQRLGARPVTAADFDHEPADQPAAH